MLNLINTQVSIERASVFAKYSLALIFIWFGLMNILGPGAQIFDGWIKGHAFLSGATERLDNGPAFIGAWQIIAGLLLVAPSEDELQRSVAGLLIALFADVALLLFFTNPVWIESMGGFPAIGSGQGLLKYVTFSGLGIYFASPLLAKIFKTTEMEWKNISLIIMLSGICLVLVWIGGMKFTLIEAQGIEGLLKTSPFFSWITKIFDLQGASNFIGIIELITVTLLLFYWKSRLLFLLGAGLCVVTFLGTLSFMFSLPGWGQDGFPYIGGTGHFLIKDLGLLAATLLLIAHQPRAN